jgi:parallel beta-helix repeat protein
MQARSILRKGLTVGVILLFIELAIASGVIGSSTKSCSADYKADEGTLSGRVTDTAMNPIKGARVRVYFHDTYCENYSDATGYYHVTDIPICYCVKNATCCRAGYNPAWVLLSIAENTTHDFVLTKTHWLYVGGSGAGNYSKIQDAVDNTSDGDTVFVYDDASPYLETVCVNTSIQVLGENETTTIIDAGTTDYAVAVCFRANYGRFEHFGLRNSGWESYALNVFDAEDFVIANNSFLGNFNGAYVEDSNQVLIADNTFIGNRAALEVSSILSSSILRNHFLDNIDGLIIYADNTLVADNIIRGNTGWGIDVKADNVSILRNVIDSTHNDGSACGIFIDAEINHIQVQHNVINENDYGILCFAVNDRDSSIVLNTFSNNSYGMSSNLCAHINIVRNNFIGRGTYAYFADSWWFQANHWDGNYWADHHGKAPRAIPGKALLLVIPLGYFHGNWCIYSPWLNFDWHPSPEPIDIGY